MIVSVFWWLGVESTGGRQRSTSWFDTPYRNITNNIKMRADCRIVITVVVRIDHWCQAFYKAYIDRGRRRLEDKNMRKNNRSCIRCMMIWSSKQRQETTAFQTSKILSNNENTSRKLIQYRTLKTERFFSHLS